MSENLGIGRTMAQVAARWPRWTGGALVGLVAAVACFRGLVLRDVGQDEIGLMGTTMAGMLDRALAVHRPESFHAHLPLAWVVRNLFQFLLGDGNVLAWRLHGALGGCLGALATWWLLYRRGSVGQAVVAGLLVAINPVLSFHAHDATNYALGPLTGALVLIGLTDLLDGRRSAIPYLACGLLLGACNDFLFAFLAFAALLLTPLLVSVSANVPTAKRAALWAWGIVAAVLVVPLTILVVRLLRVRFDDVIAGHADIPSTGSALSIIWGKWVDLFVVSYMEGYGSRGGDPWLMVLPSALLVIGLAAALLRNRGPWSVSAAVLLVATVSFLTCCVAFEQLTGVRFPIYVRSFTALLPALAVVWTTALFSGGPRLGVPLALLLLLHQGAVIVHQLTRIADTHDWAARRIAEEWQPGDLVFDLVVEGPRFTEPVASSVVRRCLPERLELPDRVWVVNTTSDPTPFELPLCLAGSTVDSGTEVYLASDGYRQRVIETRTVPMYERHSNSYLTDTVVALLQREVEPLEQPSRRITIDFEPHVGDGVGRGGSVEFHWVDDQTEQRIQDSRPYAPDLLLAHVPAAIRSLDLYVWHGPMPAWFESMPLGLLRTPDLRVAQGQLVIGDGEPEASVKGFSLVPMSDPWIGLGRRLANLVISVGVVVGFLRRRR